MQQLLLVLADHWPKDSPLDQSFARFTGDIGPAGHSLPLRLAGGLHALVLTGEAPELAAAYPPHAATDEHLTQALLQTLQTHDAFLQNWTTHAPQTNEVRRSAALIAGAHVALSHFDLPIRLSELGASGGLNLMWDHYALDIAGQSFGPEHPVLRLSPEWTGAPPPPAHPVIVDRAGVDLNPLDPTDPNDLLRLTAYLWPDQPERLANTRNAARIAQPNLSQGDAFDWLVPRLTDAPEGQLHLIQHTVAWQYFPQSAQARGTALIENAGAQATPTRPLAWLAMESDGDTTAALGATLVLRLWPGDLRLDLGRCDFHGRWFNWTGHPN